MIKKSINYFSVGRNDIVSFELSVSIWVDESVRTTALQVVIEMFKAERELFRKIKPEISSLEKVSVAEKFHVNKTSRTTAGSNKGPQTQVTFVSTPKSSYSLYISGPNYIEMNLPSTNTPPFSPAPSYGNMREFPSMSPSSP